MGLHDRLQRGIERLFFRGKSTKASKYVAFVLGNIIVMLVLFSFLLDFVLYHWTGQLYPVGSGFRLNGLFGGLDDAIPFVPEMVIFYNYFFYGMVILTMLYFAFVEYEKGYALGWSLVLINAIAFVFYAFFPVSTYWYRQALLAHPITGNFWASQVYDIFATDTPFNCFPSLHAAVSTICFYTWYQYSRLKRRKATRTLAAVTLILAAGIILSTLFIKQHYIADEIAGVLLAWGAGKLVFRYFWRGFDASRPTTGRKVKKLQGKSRRVS